MSQDPEYLAWKREKEERERKRGAYWLTDEGREEVRDIWNGDNDGDCIPPVYLDEIERLEAALVESHSKIEQLHIECGLLNGELAQEQKWRQAAETELAMQETRCGNTATVEKALERGRAGADRTEKMLAHAKHTALCKLMARHPGCPHSWGPSLRVGPWEECTLCGKERLNED